MSTEIEERRQWRIVMERLNTDDSLMELQETLRKGRQFLPMRVLRDRLRFRDYDTDRLKSDIAGAYIEQSTTSVDLTHGYRDAPKDIRVRHTFSISWPDGQKDQHVIDTLEPNPVQPVQTYQHKP